MVLLIISKCISINVMTPYKSRFVAPLPQNSAVNNGELINKHKCNYKNNELELQFYHSVF